MGAVAVKKTIEDQLKEKLIGQDHVIAKIAPYLQMYEAELNPLDRPAGIFLLVGGTGLGKTRTAEVVAEYLHGKKDMMIRIDCGEYQLDHEVSKLIGAPPGYLGHRETAAVLSQDKLDSVRSENSNLAVVLFDEIEKSAKAMDRIMLNLLDNGMIRLGDGNTVRFESSIIFLSSNVGTDRLKKLLAGNRMGFSLADATVEDINGLFQEEVRKRFPAEFINRLDDVLLYHTLERSSIEKILELELAAIQYLIRLRMGLKTFSFAVTEKAYEALVNIGFSQEFGARNLKRAIHKHVLFPLANMKVNSIVTPGCYVMIDYENDDFTYKTVTSGEIGDARWVLHTDFMAPNVLSIEESPRKIRRSSPMHRMAK